MTEPSIPPSDAVLFDAIEALEKAEAALTKLNQPALRKALDGLVESLESLSAVQLELRMAKLRVRRQLRTDPDRTPVHAVNIADTKGKPGAGS